MNTDSLSTLDFFTTSSPQTRPQGYGSGSWREAWASRAEDALRVFCAGVRVSHDDATEAGDLRLWVSHLRPKSLEADADLRRIARLCTAAGLIVRKVISRGTMRPRVVALRITDPVRL